MDTDSGPAALFADGLRRLRSEARLSYRALAEKTGYSPSALSQAASGVKLPSLSVALAYVAACGGDGAEWERRWRAAVREVVSAPADEPDSDVPPYCGLTRFEPADAGRFHGRTELTEDLLRLVRAHRLTVVVGPSGSGKSSLLRAGLIPRLRDTGDPLPRPAVIRILTPGPQPAAEHRKQLMPHEAPGDTWVIVDQFEEAFTLCTDPGQRAEFLEMLLRAGEPESRLRVVLGVRADFYGRCLEHPGLAAVVREASLPVGPMTPAELREAIVKPAAGAGLIVERALTARLVDATSGRAGGLPLLSHALVETWRRRRGRTLTLEAYEAAGGVHGAIARTAEDLYAGLDEEQAAQVRWVLLRLITPGEGTPDTGHPAVRAELDDHPDSGTDRALVLERLARPA
nr:helix-turn-helix domain-containing protein [Streptomyces melanogenes]